MTPDRNAENVCTRLRWIADPERLAQLRFFEQMAGIPVWDVSPVSNQQLRANGFIEDFDCGFRLTAAGLAVLILVHELGME